MKKFFILNLFLILSLKNLSASMGCLETLLSSLTANERSFLTEIIKLRAELNPSLTYFYQERLTQFYGLLRSKGFLDSEIDELFIKAYLEQQNKQAELDLSQDLRESKIKAQVLALDSPLLYRTSEIAASIAGTIKKNISDVTWDDLLRVKKLIISGVPTIQTGDLDGLVNLEELEIYDTQITTLPEDLFRDLQSLKILRIQKNLRLTSLSTNVFSALGNLETLVINENLIQSVPEQLLWKLTKLRDFWFTNSRVQELPLHFFKGLAQLQNLTLMRNHLTSFSQELVKDTSILYLSLTFNQLRDFRWKKSSKKLTPYINVSNNSLSNYKKIKLKLKFLYHITL